MPGLLLKSFARSFIVYISVIFLLLLNARDHHSQADTANQLSLVWCMRGLLWTGAYPAGGQHAAVGAATW